MFILLSSSEGFVAYGSICFIGVIFYTLYLLWQFARPGTPITVYFLTFLSWLIVFSICFLVPMDLIPGFQNSLDTVWSVLFWASFLLMWIIIPFASGYYDNGGFTVKHKLWMSFKFNLYLLIIAGVLGVAGIIYLTAAAAWTLDQITSLLVCASNTWGLIMLVMCAGWGLVEVPRETYYMRDYQRRQDAIYYYAANIHAEQENTWDELGATIKIFPELEKKIDNVNNDKHRGWMMIIRQVAQEREIELQQSSRRCHPINSAFLEELSSSKKISTNQMFKFHYHTKTLVKHLYAVETQWRDTVNDAVELERELAQRSDPAEMRWWLKTGRAQSYYFFAVCGIILSILIVIGEITIPASANVSPLGWLVKTVQDDFILQQVFTAVPFLYLSLCTYYPLFQLRFSKLYYIGRKRTDEGTLLLNATLLLRVSVPLAYNFMLLLRMPATSLEAFVGVVENIPFFGGSFTTIFPVFIILLNLLVLFRFFDRVGACLNMDDFKFNIANRIMDEEVKFKMQEGRTLIQSELNRRSRIIREKANNLVNNTTLNSHSTAGYDEEYYGEEEEEYYEQNPDNNNSNSNVLTVEDEDEEDEELNIQLNQNSYAGAAYAQYALQQQPKTLKTQVKSALAVQKITKLFKQKANPVQQQQSGSINNESIELSNNREPAAEQIEIAFKPTNQHQQTRNFRDSAKFSTNSSTPSGNTFTYNNINTAPINVKSSSNSHYPSSTSNPQFQSSEEEEQFDEDGNLIV